MMRKRCAYCAMERKKIEHSSSVWLLNSITLSKGKTLFPKASHLGVHIIYTFIFSLKRSGFLFGFYMFPQPL